MMPCFNIVRSVVAAALCVALAGCSTVSSGLFPEQPSMPSVPGPAMPQTGTSVCTPVGVTPGVNSGSPQSAQIASLRSRLVALQGEVSARNAALSELRQRAAGEGASYRIARNEMSASVSPSPASYQKALAALDRLGTATSALDGEMRIIARGSAEANKLMLETVGVREGNDEDKRQLNTLRGEIGQTANQLDRMVNDLSAEFAAQSAFLAKERASLAALGLPAPPVTPSTGVASSLPPPSMSQPAFVKIKFDTARVAYRETLASAVSTARRRKPDAVFDVVGISAGRSVVPEGTANAADVVNTLTSLGVDPSKIRVFNSSSPTINAHEVRIYVR
jgi:hypothetical protein